MIVVVSTYKTFELDRFFVPKELVLHATAVLAASIFHFGTYRIAEAKAYLAKAGKRVPVLERNAHEIAA